MKLFFVMDIKKGEVVAAKGGEREKYRPIGDVSHITKTSAPLTLLEEVKPKYLYVADLDRIEGRGDNITLINLMAEKVSELIADCGFRCFEELEGLKFTPVVGTETFDITRLNKRCYVSLDFKDEFLDASKKFSSWQKAVEFLNTLDIFGVIVLPLRNVGSLSANFDLAAKVLELSDHPVMLGGGISDVKDLEIAKDLGLDGVLLATAVHLKRVPLELIRRGDF